MAVDAFYAVVSTYYQTFCYALQAHNLLKNVQLIVSYGNLRSGLHE
jgi:hypothetical protein